MAALNTAEVSVTALEVSSPSLMLYDSSQMAIFSWKDIWNSEYIYINSEYYIKIYVWCSSWCMSAQVLISLTSNIVNIHNSLNITKQILPNIIIQENVFITFISSFQHYIYTQYILKFATKKLKRSYRILCARRVSRTAFIIYAHY